MGSFRDWLGEGVELFPEFGNGYRVVPDYDAYLVRRQASWPASDTKDPDDEWIVRLRESPRCLACPLTS